MILRSEQHITSIHFNVACNREKYSNDCDGESREELSYKEKYGLEDNLPRSYGSKQGRCIANWTCADWARTGNCDTKWSKYPDCVPDADPHQLVKETCNISCSSLSCGKDRRLFNID